MQICKHKSEKQKVNLTLTDLILINKGYNLTKNCVQSKDKLKNYNTKMPIFKKLLPNMEMMQKLYEKIENSYS